MTSPFIYEKIEENHENIQWNINIFLKPGYKFKRSFASHTNAAESYRPDTDKQIHWHNDNTMLSLLTN
jgi:hypothetical protein